MNKVFLIGNLGADATTKHTQGGKPIVGFTIATSSKWNDKESGKLQERTEWHRCTAWGDRWTNVVPYLKKGTKIAVEGEIRYRNAEKDGVKVTYTDINVTEIELVGARKDGGEREKPAQQSMDVDDDIPF